MRLEEAFGDKLLVIAEFQFLIGAIGRRLVLARPTHSYCFNSLLVRLEGQLSFGNLIPIDVSIPYWCDWKGRCRYMCVGRVVFQFLIGAIGSRRSGISC